MGLYPTLWADMEGTLDHVVWSGCTREFGWSQVFPLFSLYPLPCTSLCEHVCSYPTPLPPSPDPFLPIQASKAWRKNKMDESKHEIHSQVDAITAGTASVVNLTAGMWRVGVEGCPSSGEGSVSIFWLKDSFCSQKGKPRQ